MQFPEEEVFSKGTVIKVLKTCVATKVPQGKSSDGVYGGVFSLYHFINCN
jgi:hypothetical protein